MSKNHKGSPFYIFRHCDTVQKSHQKKFLGKFFHVSKGSPQFFKIFLQPAGVSQSPKGPPFEFGALNMAPTLAVLGLLINVIPSEKEH